MNGPHPKYKHIYLQLYIYSTQILDKINKTCSLVGILPLFYYGSISMFAVADNLRIPDRSSKVEMMTYLSICCEYELKRFLEIVPFLKQQENTYKNYIRFKEKQSTLNNFLSIEPCLNLT